MLENRQQSNVKGDTCQADNKWNLVKHYRAAHDGNESPAYKNILKQASMIENQVLIRSYNKKGFTYWEIWEYK